MRTLTIAMALALFPTLLIHAHPQQKQVSPTSGWKCGPRIDQLPAYYEEATLEQIEPPDWRHALIRIAVGTETKLDLWTDGDTFKLWTTAIRFRDVDKSLLDLNRACRLPMEPNDASALLKVKWENADLTAAQFAQIHRNFTNAIEQYDSSAQERYRTMIETKLGVDYFDTTNFRIVYENTYEHIEAGVWNDRENDKPMLDWIHELQKLAENSFHRSFETQ